jgi:2-octaprenyl-6-methoxyphenol hydroxylase
MSSYDIVIAGGGMVGASLAIALAPLPLRIAIVEAVPINRHNQPSFDGRAIALSPTSRNILSSLDLWPSLASEGATAIKQIHVSDRGHFGAAHLSAAEEGVEALGYVVEASRMGQAIAGRLATLPQIEILSPARVMGYQPQSEHNIIEIEQNGQRQQLTARLLIAADGSRSQLRQQVGGATWQVAYGQTAIIATVTTTLPHHHTAYERFTRSGPLALLPLARSGSEKMQHCRWSLVWSARDAQVAELLALSDRDFLDRLYHHFGRRAGRFTSVSSRHAYPLNLNFLRDPVRAGLLFIGNAAHAIHPVAGQGFNLGLRDVATLAEVITDALAAQQPWYNATTLQRYRQWRQGDYWRVMAFTDSLVRLFSNPFPPLVAARNTGLVLLDLLPPLRRLLTRQGMGLTGHQSRLARGLPTTR